MKVEERNKLIIEKYLSGQAFTQAIAKEFDLTPRQVQRIVKEAGHGKTISERNKQIAHLKNYSEILLPKKVKEYRKYLPQETRLLFLRYNDACEVCGIRRGFGCRLEVTFRNPKNFNDDMRNLKTVCRRCLQKDPAYLDVTVAKRK